MSTQTTAANIRAELARQRISGRELARRLGENYMWVQRRTSGDSPITTVDLMRIAEALHVSPLDLLGHDAA